MPYFHVVARAYRRNVLLTAQPLAQKVWSAFRSAFPGALAGVVMPDHVHVIAEARDAMSARVLAGAALSGIRRTLEGADIRWERLELPAAIPDAQHLRRQIRYVALNPCRSGLAKDPLEWIWSTHRDVAGAAVDPWVPARVLAQALHEIADGFPQRWHAYVSGDPSVHVRGTRFPRPARPTEISEQPLGVIVAAAAAAYRAPPDRILRRGPARSAFLALAHASGWRDLALIGSRVNASPLTARRRGRLGSAPEAAWLCLGDPRLFMHYQREMQTAQRGRIDAEWLTIGHPAPTRRASRLADRFLLPQDGCEGIGPE